MHGNKPLGLIDILFGFRGRIGRLAFVGYNLMTGFTLLILALATASMIAEQGSLGMIAVCLFAPWILAFWIGSALLAKRLHDLGYSALHGMWITALWYLSPWLPEPLPIVLGLAGFVAGLALIFMRGSGGPNRFGHKAGMLTIGASNTTPTGRTIAQTVRLAAP